MAVNAAQERAQQQVGRYLPLNELAGLPSVPVGFVPTIIAEQWSFAAIVKDVFGACGFAVFSDERGVVYDAHPRTGSRQAPKPPVDEQ